MESLRISRLQDIINHIESLTGPCKKLLGIQTLNDNDKEKAEVTCRKLETLHSRFSTELNQYFQMSVEPSADDISRFSTIQLESEELLTELNYKVKSSKVVMKNSNYDAISSKLPKLNLPEYDGKILGFQEFWDHFTSNIDCRNLPNVDKLLYLKASLNGEAKKLVEGLETTNKNYDIAVRMLKERYGKESIIIDAHYAALYKVKAADKTAEDCRRALNEIEKHIRVLKALGQDTNHDHLRFIITEKFPSEVIYEMKMALKSDSVEDIRKQLEVIVSAKEDASRITHENQFIETSQFTTETLHVLQDNRKQEMQFNKRSNEVKFKRNTQPTYNRGTNTKRKFPYRNEKNNENNKAREDPKKKKQKLSCIFCNENHYNDECKRYKSLKERKLKLKKRCFICFREGHKIQTCTYKNKCAHCNRCGEHNRALCPKKFSGENTLTVVNARGSTILQTAVAKAYTEENIRQENCRLLLDSGSQRSYVSKKLAKKLNLPIIENNSLVIFTFGAKDPQEIDSPLVKLQLKTRTNESFTLYANCVESITNGISFHSLNQEKLELDFVMADDGSLNDQIDILIGNDYYFSLIYDEKKKIGQNLYLIKSKFGWILSGQLDTKQPKEEELSVVTYFQTSLNVGLSEPDLPINYGNVKGLWELESIGITDSPKVTREEQAIYTFNETTKCINDRYTVSWPWKEYPPNLPSNFGLAYGRLVSLMKRIDPKTLISYDQMINQQIKGGIVEKVLDKHKPSKIVHYLPHHSVQQSDKPIRIVYDASAKTNGNKSLNECLYCGPILIEDLTGLLIKFRTHKIGITADIEKAFLQIALHENDRDVTRFLWLQDINKPATMDNLLHLRFCRVPFGIISSPFLLNATIKHHLSKSDKPQIRDLANAIYVDNVVTGNETTSKALELYKDSKNSFQEISMNLRTWSSNSPEVMQRIPDVCKDDVVKVLGLDWNIKEDTLKLRFKNINTNVTTKRDVLKIIASVYDPCSYAAPYLLAAKLFLQELWKSKIKWDATLPQETIKTWKQSVCKDLNEIKEISLSRCYIQNINNNKYTLHCFCDASLKAYATALYVTHGLERNFVIGKSRLVPLKDQDNLKIPRLELLAVLIGSRLIKFVLKHLPSAIGETILWTDSQIVIEWIKSDKLLPPFVSRRIEEIKQIKGLIIRHVPSELNPADVATKTPISTEDKMKWLNGPNFITEKPELWPPNINTNKVSSLLTRESLSKDVQNHREPIIEVEPDKIFQHDNHDDQQKETLSKIEEIKRLQAKHFPQEVVGKVTDLSRNLRLFKDNDEILRCKGRLGNADWSFDKRYPILLPKDCDFTNNIVMKTHKDNYHVGANHTLSLIRNLYWIPQGKSQVQKLLKRCYNCSKHGRGPFKAPPTPALPPERVNFSSPFTFTGIDLMGPLLIDNGNGTVKRWICLYTCLAVRATHLEVMQNLTAEEGLLALRRMISSRGVPTLITSDNALYFKLMAEILSKQYCVDNKIKWKFIPQLAPWFGGFYERLVAIVKNCMKRTLQKHLLKDSQFVTIVKEIEAILNSRPLTTVDSELDHILKPADFLTMGKCITVNITEDDPVATGTVTKMELIKSWKRALVILQEFKEMFTNRYLTSLRERYQHSPKQPRVISKSVPKIGQIVQIKGESKNREGKINELVKGDDGLCRVAKVMVGDKEFTRSITHLYPLEMDEEENHFYSTPVSTSRHHPLEPEPVDKDLAENNENFASASNHIPFDTEIDENVASASNHISFNPEIEENVVSTSNDVPINTDKQTEESEESRIKENEENDNETPNNENKKRGAAIKALEKIREWTRNLMSLL